MIQEEGILNLPVVKGMQSYLNSGKMVLIRKKMEFPVS